jgi:hypothetical protein
MNALTRKLSPSITRLIRLDHTHVVAQFHKLEADTSESVRGAVLRSICAELEIHAQLEEEIFYPALLAAGVESLALDKSVPDHDEIRRGIERVRSLDGQPALQDHALRELMNGVLHHAAEEETKVLMQAELLLGEVRLSQLGAQMTARRLEIAKPRAAELAEDLAKAAAAKTALMAAGALLAGSLLIRRLWRGIASQRGA